MTKQQSWLVVVAALVGCGKSSEPKTTEPRAKDAGAARTADATVAVATTDAGAAALPDASPPATDSAAVEKRFEECWVAEWDVAKLETVKGCYTADALVERPGAGGPAHAPDAIILLEAPYHAAFSELRGEPQLVLAQGPNVAVIGLITGTHTHKLAIAKHPLGPTNQKMGAWQAETAFVDASGHINHAWQFFDIGTVVAQLTTPSAARPAVATLPRPKEVVIATGDPREAANRITVINFLDAWSKHDRAAVAGFLADGVVWSEAPLPKDLDKTEALDRFAALWKGFSTLAIGAMTVWSAGDYSVAIETVTGTNDGEVTLPDLAAKKTGKQLSLPMLAVYKLDHDKITSVWINYARDRLELTAPPAAPTPPVTPAKPDAPKPAKK